MLKRKRIIEMSDRNRQAVAGLDTLQDSAMVCHATEGLPARLACASSKRAGKAGSPGSLDFARDKLRRRTCGFRKISFKRGQQLMEYALLIAALALGLTAMTVYAKRGLNARIKDSTDQLIGPQEDAQQKQIVEITTENTETNALVIDDSTTSEQAGARFYGTEHTEAAYGKTVSVTEKI